VTAAPSVASSAVHWIRVVVGVLAAAIIFGALALWHPPGLYLWIKAVHVMAVISWMAGMLYLPRLFVYHCEAEHGSKQSETFKVMERRLLHAIMNPAMVATYLFGLLLLATPGVVDWGAAWMYLKLVLVVGLTGLHHGLGRCRQAFAADRNRRPARFYRIVNEIPTVLMVGIVLLIVVKPF
jgi:putative membrane protein